MGTQDDAPKYGKWGKYENEQDNILIEATKLYEERLRRRTKSNHDVENNKNLLLSLDHEFMTSCQRSFILSSYVFNLSMILVYYGIMKPRQIKKWKRFVVLTPLIAIGNTLLLQYWMYKYPLQMYRKGLVKKIIPLVESASPALLV